jgi:hypothetical protein
MSRNRLCCASFFSIVFFAATANAAIQSIYFADEDTHSIRRSDADGSNVTTIVSGLVAPRGVAIDQVGGELYWSDGHAVPRVIQRSTRIIHGPGGVDSVGAAEKVGGRVSERPPFPQEMLESR